MADNKAENLFRDTKNEQASQAQMQSEQLKLLRQIKSELLELNKGNQDSLDFEKKIYREEKAAQDKNRFSGMASPSKLIENLVNAIEQKGGRYVDQGMGYKKQIDSSFSKIAFGTTAIALLAPTVGAIFLAAMATPKIKQFFDTATQPQKQMARSLKAIASATASAKLAGNADLLGKGAKNILKHGLGGGLQRNVVDAGFSAFDKFKSVRKTMFGNFWGDMVSGVPGAAKKAGTTMGSYMPDLKGGGVSDFLRSKAAAGGLIDGGKNVFGSAKGLVTGGAANAMKNFKVLTNSITGLLGLANKIGLDDSVRALQKAGAAGAMSFGGSMAGTAVKAGAGAVGSLGKMALRGTGKLALKSIPMIGGVFSIMSGMDRWKKGGMLNKTQALIDFGSGAANFIPGIGWPISLGMDLLNAGIDVSQMDPGKLTSGVDTGMRALKLGGKLGLKFLKKIPGLGAIISIPLAIQKFKSGDTLGGLLEAGSGIASLVPGLGTAVSIGIDMISTARDFGVMDNIAASTTEPIKKIGKSVLRNLPVIGTFIQLKESMALWNQGKKKEAMMAGAKALSTMIPGVGVIYSFMDYFGDDSAEIDKAKAQGGAAPKTAPGANGKISKKKMAGLAKGYRTNLAAASAKGDKAGVAFWQKKQDALIATNQAGGIATAAPSDESGETTDSSLTSSLKIMPGVNINGLKPDTKANLLKMADEYAKQTGQPLQLNSAYRSVRKQQDLYRKLAPGMAAAPGRSMHNWGIAFDIQSAQGNSLAQDGLLSKYGFHRPVNKEPWHIEDANYDRRALKLKGTEVASIFNSGKTPSDEELRATGLPMAALGAITNTPTIAGEAGPEAIIPLNDMGIGVLAQAMNKAMSMNTVNSGNKSSNKDSKALETFLLERFTKVLAREIADATKGSKGSNNKTQVSVF
jgi:LAS superfamily LD-carboxypeptidase LdcB